MNLCKFISLICHNSFKILKEDMDIGARETYIYHGTKYFYAVFYLENVFCNCYPPCKDSVLNLKNCLITSQYNPDNTGGYFRSLFAYNNKNKKYDSLNKNITSQYGRKVVEKLNLSQDIFAVILSFCTGNLIQQ